MGSGGLGDRLWARAGKSGVPFEKQHRVVQGNQRAQANQHPPRPPGEQADVRVHEHAAQDEQDDQGLRFHGRVRPDLQKKGDGESEHRQSEPVCEGRLARKDALEGPAFEIAQDQDGAAADEQEEEHVEEPFQRPAHTPGYGERGIGILKGNEGDGVDVLARFGDRGFGVASEIVGEPGGAEDDGDALGSVGASLLGVMVCIQSESQSQGSEMRRFHCWGMSLASCG